MGQVGDFSQDQHAGIAAQLPILRIFARTLTRERNSADGLVIRAVVRGLGPRAQRPHAADGTVWLLRVLHDLYQDDTAPGRAGSTSNRQGATEADTNDDMGDEFGAFRRAFWQLQDTDRKALILTVAAGLSSAEAAVVCGCTPGMIGAWAAQGRDALLRGLQMPPIQGAPEMAHA